MTTGHAGRAGARAPRGRARLRPARHSPPAAPHPARRRRRAGARRCGPGRPDAGPDRLPLRHGAARHVPPLIDRRANGARRDPPRRRDPRPPGSRHRGDPLRRRSGRPDGATAHPGGVPRPARARRAGARGRAPGLVRRGPGGRVPRGPDHPHADGVHLDARRHRPPRGRAARPRRGA